MDLLQKKCVPCEGGLEKLNETDALQFKNKYTPNWQIIENNTKIYREFKFKNFLEAQSFVNEVGKIAEAEGHHPDIMFGWGYAKIYIQTHAINGLHENDFILASKIDVLTI